MHAKNLCKVIEKCQNCKILFQIYIKSFRENEFGWKVDFSVTFNISIIIHHFILNDGAYFDTIFKR